MKLSPRFPVILILALGIPLAWLGMTLPHAVRAQTMQVTMQNFSFQPGTVTVPVGSTVTWTNQDTAPHTATADDNSWTTPTLQTGQSASITFNTAGTFTYHCSIHPTMHGSIIVTAQAGGTATVGTTSVGTATATVGTTPSGTATATPGSLAAYPVGVDTFSVQRRGPLAVFRWHMFVQDGVRGYRLFAGTHRLTQRTIPVHSSLSYKYRTHWTGKGPFSLGILYGGGKQVKVPAQ